jgi:hypothetical protein
MAPVSKDHPVALRDVKFVEATCRCGHKGRSQRPDLYVCSGCYYTSRAEYNERQVLKLRERADRLSAEAATFRERAAKFKHGPRTHDK